MCSVYIGNSLCMACIRSGIIRYYPPNLNANLHNPQNSENGLNLANEQTLFILAGISNGPDAGLLTVDGYG